MRRRRSEAVCLVWLGFVEMVIDGAGTESILIK